MLAAEGFHRTPGPPDTQPRHGRWWVAVALGGLLYFLATRLPFQFNLVHQAYLSYPASAVALGVTLLLGRRAWPGIALAALAVNLGAKLPLPAALALTACQTAEGWVAATLLLRVWPIRPNLVGTGDMLRFMGVAALSNLVASALLGSTVLRLSGLFQPVSPLDTLVSWFLGDLGPLLCLTPFLLTVFQAPLRRWLGWRPLPDAFAPVASRRPGLEGLLVLGVSLGLVTLTFGSGLLPMDWRLPLRFACFLPAIWAAIRLGLRGTTTLLAATGFGSIALLWMHTHGQLPMDESRMVQLFLIFLPLATLVAGVAAEESRSAGMRYRTLVEESSDALLVIDRTGTLLAGNGALATLMDQPLDGLLDTPYADLFDPEELAARPLDWGLLLASGRIHTERVVQRASGLRIPVEIHACVLGDATIQITLRDLRERQAAETRRLELERQLAQSHKMEAVGTLAGGVAHDFNNLLTIVLTHLEQLRAEPTLPAEIQARLTPVLTAAQRGAEITRQLLSFSRRGFSSPIPLDLRTSLEEVQVLLRSSFDPRIRIQVEAPASLPWVMADPTQIQQILLNLCLNAQDAMPDGGLLTLRVAAGVGAQGPEAHLEVSDTGRGMDADTCARAFDPFFTTKGVGKGTGLGLSMVFGLVHQHGGWIQVDSAPGRGATFRLGFPALAEPPAGEEIPTSLLALPPEGPVTVLFADDEADIRDVCRDLLEGAGYRVLLAGDGQEAMDLYRTHRAEIRLAVLDLAMPRVHGTQVLKALRAEDPALPVLVCSGYSLGQGPEAPALDEGTAFLQKPYRTQAFLQAIRETLGHGR